MPYQLPSSDEINAVNLSWRRYLLPAIHPEGVKILAVEAVIVVLVGLLGLLWAPLYSLYSLGLAVLVFSFYFFRNPTRVPPVGDRLVLAPADGIVSNIVEMVPPPELGCGDQPLIRVSIFMSVFSVHVNRAPVGGTVTALKYVPGKFVSVQDKDSEDNETAKKVIKGKAELPEEFTLLKNRLSLGFEYFNARTTDLLVRKTVSDITGLSQMWSNDGELKNSGFNVNVNAQLISTQNWQWQLGATLGHYENEITKLPNTRNNLIETYKLDEVTGQRVENSKQTFVGYTSSIYGADNVLTAVGHAAGVFYGYKTNGVYATTAEAQADGLKYPTGLSTQPSRDFQAGDVRFVDTNGDGWISEADKVVIGDPNPTIYGNIYTSLSWKNLSLDVVFKYSLGNDIYNYQRMQLESANNIWNQSTAVVNRWKYENQQTDVPRTMSADSEYWVNNERFSDRWIEDGSYLKLKRVRLTYKVPLALSWLQGLSVWGEANNVVTLTKYLGQDPEVSCSNSVLYQGIDTGMLPSGRNFNLGLTINL